MSDVVDELMELVTHDRGGYVDDLVNEAYEHACDQQLVECRSKLRSARNRLVEFTEIIDELIKSC